MLYVLESLREWSLRTQKMILAVIKIDDYKLIVHECQLQECGIEKINSSEFRADFFAETYYKIIEEARDHSKIINRFLEI